MGQGQGEKGKKEKKATFPTLDDAGWFPSTYIINN